jgi:pilus assembly protein CpaB
MAIVLGLVAAYIVRQSLEKPIVAAAAPPPLAPRPAPAKPDLVQVVFAKGNLPKHARITADDVFVSFVGKETKAAVGTFRGSALAEGRITNQAIRAGQALREEYLLGIGEGLPDLAERLPPGHRAVTIQVQGADTGGKRLEEGDYIDLALIVEGTHPDLGELLTRTLLRSVLVVDANANRPLVRQPAKPADEPPATITVAVQPADANKLIVAERTGTLVATLVSMKDVAAGASPPEDDTITRRELLGLKEVPPPPRRFTVEKWTGGTLRVIEMSGDRVRESRDVSAGSRETTIQAPVPASAPAHPASADWPQPATVPSGIKLPAAVAAADEAAR